MTHTSGPWSCNTRNGATRGVSPYIEGGGSTVASVSMERDEWEANALLIAAAPDMLALLEEIVNADLLDPDDDFTRSVEEMLASARGQAVHS